MYHKQTGSLDHTIAKIVTVPPLLGGCTTTHLRAVVLRLPVNVIKECLTSVHILHKIIMPTIFHMPSPQWAAHPIEGMTLVNLAPVHCALLIWVMAIILPVPLPLAQAATQPSGASVVSVVDPIPIALTTIVRALLLTFESGAVTVPPLTLLVGAFYS
jgi:hypothetical protein